MNFRIALVQQHAGPTVEENVERGAAAFIRAARKGARLIAFAELAFSPFLPQRPAGADATAKAEPVPGPTTDRFRRLAAEHRVVTVLNLFEKKGGRTYDSSPVIDADGRLLGVTRMMHIMEGPGFHERGYYHPGKAGKFVYETAVGRLGIAICYDRHFPEYMRGLALLGAEIVVIPQAGATGEWTEGIFEAEVRVAAFQNGYFAALVNRVGREAALRFTGGSFVTDPDGLVIARAPEGRDAILLADCDTGRIALSAARRHFLADRRPSAYGPFGLTNRE
jgi:N-carbamoylputrescine amidase